MGAAASEDIDSFDAIPLTPSSKNRTKDAKLPHHFRHTPDEKRACLIAVSDQGFAGTVGAAGTDGAAGAGAGAEAVGAGAAGAWAAGAAGAFFCASSFSFSYCLSASRAVPLVDGAGRPLPGAALPTGAAGIRV